MMQITTPDLFVNDVVRAYRNSEGLHPLYGTWRPSELKRKTFSIHETEPDNTLLPTQLILEISDGRRYVIEQATTYEERLGEHGLAWTQVYGRPFLRTSDGLKASIPFVEDAPEPADTPKKRKWWSR